MKRRDGGNVEEKVVETIFHRALSRVAPLVAPRPRLILAGETEDKGGTREEGKKGKREKIVNENHGRSGDLFKRRRASKKFIIVECFDSFQR